MEEDKVRDECGVIGIFDRAGGDVGKNICYGLFSMQHRGHISCGIVTNDKYKLTAVKDNGLVNDVFDAATLRAAQENPEKYASLQVRVCGWNVFFNHLSRAEQDEFIRQAEHEEGIR